MDFLGYSILGNPVKSWLLAIVVSMLVYAVLKVARGVLLRRTRKLAQKTETDVDDFICDLLEEVRNFFLIGLAFYVGLRFVDLQQDAREIIGVLMAIFLLLQMGFWLSGLAMYLLKKRAEREDKPAQAATLKSMSTFIKGMVWAVVLVMALDTIPGVEVSTLVTTLGITGIAVAFAIQSVLSDLFAALSITLDQPFVVGDFVEVGDLSGTVEKIGLKSTRVRSLYGEQLIFSNSDMLNSRIRNYEKMERRRVALKFGVTYQTPHEKLKAIPAMVEKVISGLERVTFQRAHFTGFGDSTLDFEVVYWVEDADYIFFMDVQQAVDMGIFERFEQENIEFAYPTQTVFVENGPV